MTERAQTAIQRRPPEETGRLGMEIYERKIRERVDPDQKGKIVAIDVESEDWTISANEIDATDRLKFLRGDAHDPENVFVLRVGCLAVHWWVQGVPLKEGDRSYIKSETPTTARYAEILTRKSAPKPPARKRKGSSNLMDFDEKARLGKKIYERDIRAQVESGIKGRVVAIDVDSGEWTIARDALGAHHRMLESHPEAENILCITIGYREAKETSARRFE